MVGPAPIAFEEKCAAIFRSEMRSEMRGNDFLLLATAGPGVLAAGGTVSKLYLVPSPHTSVRVHVTMATMDAWVGDSIAGCVGAATIADHSHLRVRRC